MNNLKFRAYIKSIQKIVNVTEIDFNNKMLTLNIATNKVYPETSYWWKETELAFSQVIIMQSTGLKDKNGKEIFEGDILNCGYIFTGSSFEEQDDYIEDIGVVKIVNCGAVVKIYEEIENLIDVLNTCEDIEVIGNIYENKELLENE